MTPSPVLARLVLIPVAVIAVVAATVLLAHDPSPPRRVEAQSTSPAVVALLHDQTAGASDAAPTLESELDQAITAETDRIEALATLEYLQALHEAELAEAAREVDLAPRPDPSPVLSTAVPASGGSCGGWHDSVAELWPADQVATACSKLMCESGGDPRAHNASGASGLMQLMPVHSGRFEAHGWSYYDDVYDGWKNLVIAAELWADSGWSPWVC
jgi:hypothetical protein